MPVPKPPAKLKSLMPFITRAHQIEKTDPVIAYWCYYWAVQLVLSGNLHSGDAEATQYTTALLDELEARKETLLPNDAITDDLAAQAYVENFATKVFNNADRTLQARKVSRQTADNFLAASTFLELCKIFPNIDPEILSKIKFSKYQASRIIKAFQAGEDPNLPIPEGAQGSVSPASNPENPGKTPPPRPTVEDAIDEDSHLPPPLRVYRESAFPPTPPPIVPSSSTADPPRPTTSTSDRFPLHQNTHLNPPNKISDSEYFPTIPIGRSLSPISPDRTTTNTPAGPMSPFHMPARAEAPHHPPPVDIIRTDTDDISDFPPPHLQYPPAAPPTQFPPQHFNQSSALHINHSYTPPPPLPSMPYGTPNTPHQYYSTPPPPSAPVHISPPRSVPQPPPQTQYYHTPQPSSGPQEPFVDEESITKAQKHAKWAISALNYEDITTAVKELRAALKTLGAN